MEIDVVYTNRRPGREDAIKEISNTLKESKNRIDGIGIHSEFLRTKAGDEVKVLVQRGNSQVKPEVNFVFGGTRAVGIWQCQPPVQRTQARGKCATTGEFVIPHRL